MNNFDSAVGNGILSVHYQIVWRFLQKLRGMVKCVNFLCKLKILCWPIPVWKMINLQSTLMLHYLFYPPFPYVPEKVTKTFPFSMVLLLHCLFIWYRRFWLTWLWYDLDLCLKVVSRSCQPLRYKNLPPFSMVHLLHRLYGVDALGWHGLDMILTFVWRSYQGHVNHCVTFNVEHIRNR